MTCVMLMHAFFACVSAAGLTEEQYTNMTLRLTLAVAKRLCTLNPEATFIYISGAGADSTEQSSTMWARVRGMTENELLRLPFKRVHVLRPGVIQRCTELRQRPGLTEYSTV